MITEKGIQAFQAFIQECREDGEAEDRFPFLLRQFMKSYGVQQRRQDLIDIALEAGKPFQDALTKAIAPPPQ